MIERVGENTVQGPGDDTKALRGDCVSRSKKKANALDLEHTGNHDLYFRFQVFIV